MFLREYQVTIASCRGISMTIYYINIGDSWNNGA